MIINLFSKQSFHNYRLTLFGYVLIGTACNGFYQKYFWDKTVTPYLFWIIIGFAGGLILTYKEYRQRKEDHVSLFFFDLLLIIPVILIPRLPIRPGFCMFFMLSYGVVFIITYCYIYIKSHKG